MRSLNGGVGKLAESGLQHTDRRASLHCIHMRGSGPPTCLLQGRPCQAQRAAQPRSQHPAAAAALRACATAPGAGPRPAARCPGSALPAAGAAAHGAAAGCLVRRRACLECGGDDGAICAGARARPHPAAAGRPVTRRCFQLSSNQNDEVERMKLTDFLATALLPLPFLAQFCHFTDPCPFCPFIA